VAPCKLNIKDNKRCENATRWVRLSGLWSTDSI